MHIVPARLRYALLLSNAFRHDAFMSQFFDGITGSLCRLAFYIDEVGTRRRSGRIITRDNCLGLAGYPPYHTLRQSDLSLLTRALIACQGREVRERWNAAFRRHMTWTHSSHCMYLSALACAPKSRNKGIASAVLTDLKRYADSDRLDIVCEVTDQGLIAWYEHRGFRVIERIEEVGTLPITMMAYFHREKNDDTCLNVR